MSIAQKNERGGTLAALFVRRPVMAVVINALIIVAGLAALLGAEVRELPSVEQPVLSISTSFTGAAAETVDREITAIVEGAVARVQGVTAISSSSIPSSRSSRIRWATKAACVFGSSSGTSAGFAPMASREERRSFSNRPRFARIAAFERSRISGTLR